VKTAPGGRYRVALKLQRATHLGPSWLVGAFAVSYSGADVTAIEEYTGQVATVAIRWRKGQGDVSVGDRVSILTDGLSLPGQAIPEGVVSDVTQIGELPVPSSLESGISVPVQLTIAGALLLSVVYFSSKIQARHGNASTA
jgi:hypothetical protein